MGRRALSKLANSLGLFALGSFVYRFKVSVSGLAIFGVRTFVMLGGLSKFSRIEMYEVLLLLIESCGGSLPS